MTIDKYAYVTLDPSPDGLLHLHAVDTDVSAVLSPDQVSPEPGPLQLLKGVYLRIVAQFLGDEHPRCVYVPTPMRHRVPDWARRPRWWWRW
ncbi:hypothetical protein [Thermomonas carbonis]|uniref:hypothetical protein n=1 Tax=Thermomonas carbonis TaxID=1463158 RepID=UPI001F3B6E45|nr:hypothetical protein [Thermomonas carbonis]